MDVVKPEQHQYGKTQVCLEPKEATAPVEKEVFHNSKPREPVITQVPPAELDTSPEKKVVVERLPTVIPLPTIGKIWAGAKDVPTYTGTGVLVGRDLLLTASHIVPWNKDGWWMRFAPSYSPPVLSSTSEPFGDSFVSDARGWGASGTAAWDMAICKLYTPLGNQNPTWTACLSFSDDGSYIHGNDSVIAGYDPVTTPDALNAVVSPASVMGVQDFSQFKLLESYEDPPSGWEGGVIYTWWNGVFYVTGVLSGMVVVNEGDINEGKSGWAGGTGLTDLVNWAWQNWT